MGKNANQTGRIDAVMTSLRYLETETNKAGLKEVSSILKKTINDIEGWVSTGSCGGSTLQEIVIGYYAIYWSYFTEHLRIAGAICPGILKAIEPYTS